ncbi:uncharacterized protein LOC143470521 isoform X3 [Clavelina lepadiformis]|uniref:uncharacterized protein LOC143470521 isoform X3 n=1 Tax=Clavelina lepadiformis TaxID=159417 RepID=UPI004041A599
MVSLKPSEIRFTQDSIAMYFQNGEAINNVCERIALGELNIDDFPKIEVVPLDEFYFSLDNRRLYMFRVLEILGVTARVPVIFKNPTTDRKLTTINKGCHIEIRKSKDNNGKWVQVTPYRHCPCSVQVVKRKFANWWDEVEHCHKSQSAIFKKRSKRTQQLNQQLAILNKWNSQKPASANLFPESSANMSETINPKDMEQTYNGNQAGNSKSNARNRVNFNDHTGDDLNLGSESYSSTCRNESPLTAKSSKSNILNSETPTKARTRCVFQDTETSQNHFHCDEVERVQRRTVQPVRQQESSNNMILFFIVVLIIIAIVANSSNSAKTTWPGW